MATTYDQETGKMNTEAIGTVSEFTRKRFVFVPDVEKLLGGIQGVDPTAIETLKRKSKSGFPVEYYFLGGRTNDIQFVINTQTLKEMDFIFPMIATALTGNSEDERMIRSILHHTPNHLGKTQTIEIGLNFVRRNEYH